MKSLVYKCDRCNQIVLKHSGVGYSVGETLKENDGKSITHKCKENEYGIARFKGVNTK